MPCLRVEGLGRTMMNQTPSSIDRVIAHFVVGLIAGKFSYKTLGAAGAVFAALVVVLVHEALDAPVAHILSAATSSR